MTIAYLSIKTHASTEKKVEAKRLAAYAYAPTTEGESVSQMSSLLPQP
jgi:hypothetical protein